MLHAKCHFHIINTMEPPRIHDSAKMTPVTKVAISDDGAFKPTAALLPEYWPRSNVGLGSFTVILVAVAIAVGIASVSSGYPEYVWVAAAPEAVELAPGIFFPEKATILDFVALKLVCAIPICSFSILYTTYAERKKVSPNRMGSLPAG